MAATLPDDQKNDLRLEIPSAPRKTRGARPSWQLGDCCQAANRSAVGGAAQGAGDAPIGIHHNAQRARHAEMLKTSLALSRCLHATPYTSRSPGSSESIIKSSSPTRMVCSAGRRAAGRSVGGTGFKSLAVSSIVDSGTVLIR